MNTHVPGTTTPATTQPGSGVGSPTTQPGAAPAAEGAQTPPVGSPAMPAPAPAAQPVPVPGQPTVPVPAPAAPVAAPPVDPLANFAAPSSSVKNITPGAQDFSNAVATHTTELSAALESGDPQTLQKLGSLKPKMRAQVVEELSKKFTIGKDAAKFSTYEELAGLLGQDPASGYQNPGNADHRSTLALQLENQFRSKLEATGMKFDAFKGTPQYTAVATEAVRIADMLEAQGVPLSKFGDFFNFDAQYAIAMQTPIMANAQQQAQQANQQIAAAQQGLPTTTPAPHVGDMGVQAGQGRFPAQLDTATFLGMPQADRQAYHKEHRREDGGIALTDQ